MFSHQLSWEFLLIFIWAHIDFTLLNVIHNLPQKQLENIL